MAIHGHPQGLNVQQSHVVPIGCRLTDIRGRKLSDKRLKRVADRLEDFVEYCAPDDVVIKKATHFSHGPITVGVLLPAPLPPSAPPYSQLHTCVCPCPSLWYHNHVCVTPCLTASSSATRVQAGQRGTMSDCMLNVDCARRMTNSLRALMCDTDLCRSTCW